MGGTAARAELTASEAGRCCDEQAFRALGCLRVYKGAHLGQANRKSRLEGQYERLPRNERNYDVSPDGEWFLIVKSQENEERLVAVLTGSRS